jgi:hypothetical protein
VITEGELTLGLLCAGLIGLGMCVAAISNRRRMRRESWSFQAIWVRRVIPPGAAAANSDRPKIRCEGYTGE